MALTPVQEQAITVIRIARGWGPDRIALVLRLPRATVHRAIVRLGLRRTKVPAPPAARYERAGPATWSTSTRRNSDASSAGRDTG